MRLALSVCVFVFVAVSHASSFSCDNRDFVLLHFTKFVAGREVAAVKAHIGAVYSNAKQEIEWRDVKDVKLARVGDHFFAKAELKSAFSDGESRRGLAIQYWVDFKDGLTWITDPALNELSPRNLLPRENIELTPEEEDFHDFIDATESTVTSVQKCTVS